MEMAAAFAFGKVKGISIGAILIVSDEVREGGVAYRFFFTQNSIHREKVIEALLVHLPEMSRP